MRTGLKVIPGEARVLIKKKNRDKRGLVPDKGFSIASGGVLRHCFLANHSIHGAIGLPFHVLSSGFLASSHRRGPLCAPCSEWARADAKISDAGRPSVREQVSPLSACSWGSRSGSMGKGTHLRGSTPTDR